MATINIQGSSLGNALQDLLMADDLEPGDGPAYATCKAIFSYHPLGQKIADAPVAMAMSQERRIAVPGSPEERVVDRFKRTWKAMGIDHHIFNTKRLSRVYGIASVAMVADGVTPSEPIEYDRLPTLNLSFNVIDPLNSAGSLVLSQDPNAIDFQKPGAITVNGTAYHPSRTCTVLNEDPIYLDYTRSAFGYVGRSVYQRALFPLKSFINTMQTDDMVSRKAGLLIAFMKMPGSIIDGIMAAVAGVKRALLQQGVTDNVLSMGSEDKVESLNLQNIDGASSAARRNILENIASAVPMPAKLLLQETFAEGFGEGTEDAKYIAQFIDRIRIEMQPLYDYFDPIVMYRAWTKDWYETIQKDFPEEFSGVDFTTAFYRFKNAFTAVWPNLLEEPESEKVKIDEVRLRALISIVQVLIPNLDQANRATVIQTALDNINQNKVLFQSPFVLDYDALKKYEPAEAESDTGSPRPYTIADSDPVRSALDSLSASVARLPDRRTAPKRIAAQ